MIIKILDDSEKLIIERSYCNVPEMMGNSLISLLDSIVRLGNNLNLESSILGYDKEDKDKEKDK